MNSGYIVCDENGPLALGKYTADDPKHGVLLAATRIHPVSVFATRTAARRAIELTNRYAEHYDMPWERKHTIYRLSSNLD